MKLKAQYEINTFLTCGGYFAINQVDGLGDDAIVILSPDQCRALSKELKLMADYPSWWDSEEE